MHGLMQDRPLSLPMLMDGMEHRFSRKHVTTTQPSGTVSASYGDVAERVRRLAGVLDHLGVPVGARVGSFGWNSQRHLELYMAVPCSGRVLHTVNHRLFADDIAHIVDDAADDVLFIDRSLLDVVHPLLERCPSVRHLVVMDDGSPAKPPADPRVHDYETLLGAARPVAAFGGIDERTAAALCYTSGTTGRPKGVLYDHRSIVLHAMTLLMADTFAIGEDDTVMPIVPMFHVNAWGLPYAALMAGANLVMPGPVMSPERLVRAMETCRVTFAAAVATVWRGILPHAGDADLSALRRAVSGGGSLPVALSRAFHEKAGIPLTSSWGMTETSPLVCSARVPGETASSLTEDERITALAAPGPPTVLCSLRLVAEDGSPAPRDGRHRGELQVAGPTVAAAYFGGSPQDSAQDSAFTEDGWLRTGDVATIDPFGVVRIVDRTKDLVKSGGEWISSVELENEIMAMPDVLEAAVIAVPDDKWGERPLACVVPVPDAGLTAESVRRHLAGRVAKWWIPEEVIMLDALPRTASGKFAKAALRRSMTATGD
ncbi:long-chain fatty acid--CoA ligase [Streptomyces sp. H-KF8]|uniref:long-chain fatty acid--CoA ligase n=1 Tax=Streptomyces sp. H-KF8 TaxID=1727216 RepID=UPI0007EE2562|nr:long-chain fatty acid--CoA ligase [Streptomyces sp. H-KF8]OBQ53036.1 long-chain fatty acid--CoA ligase [Streptomyces sp. H-KF8]